MDNDQLEYVTVFLQEMHDLLREWEEVCLKLEKNPSALNLGHMFRLTHSMKGAASTMGFDELASFIHLVEESVQKARSGKSTVDGSTLELWFECHNILGDWVSEIETNQEYTPEITTTLEKLRKSLVEENFGEELSSQGFVILNPLSRPEYGESKNTLSPGEPTNSDQKPDVILAGKENPDLLAGQKVRDPGSFTEPAGVIRISMTKIDRLFRIVGELSIQNEILLHSMETKNLNSSLTSSAINLINKGVHELQDQTFSLRMQPVRQLFIRLQRVVSDVGRRLKKNVVVSFHGEYEEFDKGLLENMLNPLAHIVRNAVDHGIESKEERKKLGKPDQSVLHLTATSRPGGVLLTIADDGRGLDPEKICERAREMGLMDETENLRTSEIYQILFRPGFTTAKEVSEISGRGVGLDVVQTAIEEVGGSVTVQSSPGKGTTFEIMLPSTMAVIDALIVEVDGSNFAVPVAEISEIVSLNDYIMEKSPGADEAFFLRGKVVPVENLKAYFPGPLSQMKDYKQGKGKDRVALVTSDRGERFVAFEVDGVAGHQPVVARNLGEKIKKSPGINGGTILGNGQPGLILDLAYLTRKFLERQRSESGVGNSN